MEQAWTDTPRAQRSKVASLVAPAGAERSYGNMRVLADDLASTWTKTYNAANELTQMQNSAQGTTVTFDYDSWGRTTEKALGGNSAEYAWRYGSMLHEITSTMPDEGNVSYACGGDRKRRGRTDISMTLTNIACSSVVFHSQAGSNRRYVHGQECFPPTVAVSAHLD